MTVPVYERRLSAGGLPDARVQAPGGADAYGAGIGRAVEGFAAAAIKMNEDLEDAQTLGAYNNFRRDVSAFHHSPDKGVLNRTGADAGGLSAEANRWMDEKMEEYARNMKSPRMAENFRRMAWQTIISQGDHNSRHEAGEIRKYRIAEADATIKTAIDDAGIFFYDDEAVGVAKSRGLAALEVRLRGLGDESRRAALAEFDNEISMARLVRMIEDDPELAEEWYKENKDSFTADGRLRAEGALRSRIDRLNIERAVLDAWNTWGLDERSGTHAIEVNEKLTFEQRNRAASLYQARVADENRFDEREIRGWFDDIRDGIANAANLEEAAALIDFSNAFGWQRAQLEGIAAQLFRPESFQEDIYHYNQAYSEVMSGAIDTAEDFLYRWSGHLSDGSLKSMIRPFYSDRGSGGGGPDGSRRTYVGDTTAAVMKHVRESVLPGRYKEDSLEWSRFVTRIGDAIFAEENKLGRRLTPLEKNVLINENAKSVSMTNYLYGNVSYPAYIARMAKDAGYEFRDLGNIRGFVRQAPDGAWEEFDPYRMPQTLTELRPSEAGRPVAPPLQPIPDRKPQAGSPRETSGASERAPLRMRDGREIGGRRRGRPNAGAVSASSTGRAFLDEITPWILETAAEIDVLPSVIAAQAILESGWGKSRIGNNIFGVKAGSSWNGRTVTTATHEEIGGQRVRTNATFRDYDSVADSILDLGRVLSSNRYAAVIGERDFTAAARALQAAGYATDSEYAKKLIKIIEDNRLYELDKGHNPLTLQGA